MSGRQSSPHSYTKHSVIEPKRGKSSEFMWWFWVYSTPTVCLVGNYSSSTWKLGSLESTTIGDCDPILSAHSQCCRWHLQWWYLPLIHLQQCWFDGSVWIDGRWVTIWYEFVGLMVYDSMNNLCLGDTPWPPLALRYQLWPPVEEIEWWVVADGKPNKKTCHGVFDLVFGQGQGISNSIHISWFPSLLEWLPYQL